jgi:hypothetical protein
MKKRKKLKKESWINKQTNREEGEKALKKRLTKNTMFLPQS